MLAAWFEGGAAAARKLRAADGAGEAGRQKRGKRGRAARGAGGEGARGKARARDAKGARQREAKGKSALPAGTAANQLRICFSGGALRLKPTECGGEGDPPVPSADSTPGTSHRADAGGGPAQDLDAALGAAVHHKGNTFHAKDGNPR